MSAVGYINPWTEERIQYLKDCIKKKLSAGMAAKFFAEKFHGRFTRNMLLCKANRIGLSFLSVPGTKRKIRDRRKDANGAVLRYIANRKTAFVEQPTSSRMVSVPQGEYLYKNLLELNQSTECHYIEGDDFLFCGAPAQESSRYCDYHFELTHQKPQPRSTPRVFRDTFRQG